MQVVVDEGLARPTLIGRPPSAVSLARGSLPVRPPSVPVSLPSDLLERRPDIATAERRMATEKDDTRYAAIAKAFDGFLAENDAGRSLAAASSLNFHI